MATTITRSSAEVLRLMKAEWGTTEYDAILVDTTGAGTQPTAASSVATWLTYAIVDIEDPGLTVGYPFGTITSSTFTYDAVDGRAESPVYTFDFTSFISADFALFSSTTVTHIIFCDAYGLLFPTTNPPFLVLSESPSLTLTGSTSLSRSVQLFGRTAI